MTVNAVWPGGMVERSSVNKRMLIFVSLELPHGQLVCLFRADGV